MLAWRGSLPDIFRKLAHLGYQGIDLMVRDPGALRPAEIAALAKEHGIAVAAVSTGQLRKEDALSLSNADSSARKGAVERTKCVVDLAACFGAQVNIGTLRGHLDGDRDSAMLRCADSLAEITEHGHKCGVAVAVEPQCRWVSNWLNTVSETVQWMQTWTPEPWILYDLYHALLEERSIFAPLIRYRRHVTYVQVSDSNRGAPGDGSVPFGEIVRVLAALEYDGYLCVECRQDPNSEEAARRSAGLLLHLLKEANTAS